MNNRTELPIGLVSIGVWVILCALLLSGCVSREEASKEVQTEQVRTTTQTTTAPVVVESTFGQVTIQPAKVEQVQTVERRQITDTQSKAETTAQIPPAVQQVAQAGAVGLGGMIPGLGGIAGAAFGLWQMLRARRATGALGAVVDAVEDFKSDSADGHSVEKLETALSRKMDKAHKRLVKDLKG